MRALRFLGLIWCLPWSVLGLLVAAVGGGQLLRYSEWGVELSARPGWLIAKVFDWTGTCGATWGCVVFYATPAPAERTVRHERRHILQAMVLGPLFPVVYLLCSVFAMLSGGNAYRDNALEQDARQAERG